MRLSDPTWTKTEAAQLADLLYLVRGTESIKADLAQVQALFSGLSGLALITANTTLTQAHNGRPVFIAADQLTLELDVPVGWWCLIGSAQFSATLSIPAGAEGPQSVDPILSLLTRLPDGALSPGNPVPTYALLPLATAPQPASWVHDAPDTSLADLAAHVNLIRDALVTAGVMSQ